MRLRLETRKKSAKRPETFSPCRVRGLVRAPQIPTVPCPNSKPWNPRSSRPLPPRRTKPSWKRSGVAALGKKGSVSEQLKTLGKLSPEERREMGPAINGLKARVGEALGARREVLQEAALNARLEAERVDVTLPLRAAPSETGRIHPVSQVIDELTAIFADMGFSIAEGPDVETDHLNFHRAELPGRPSGA
eukprot:jgi/Tetstr1/446390/TSEL_033932.t1